MQNLEKRVAALELASPQTDEQTIICRYVRPGHLDDEIYLLTDNDGNAWTRHPGETEGAFIDRASKEVKRNAWGIRSLSGRCEAAPC
jgi:hypothetical protein